MMVKSRYALITNFAVFLAHLEYLSAVLALLNGVRLRAALNFTYFCHFECGFKGQEITRLAI